MLQVRKVINVSIVDRVMEGVVEVFRIHADFEHGYNDLEKDIVADYVRSDSGKREIVRLLQRSIKTEGKPIKIDVWEYERKGQRNLTVKVLYHIEKEIKRLNVLEKKGYQLLDEFEKIIKGLDAVSGRWSCGWERLNGNDVSLYLREFRGKGIK